MQGRRRYEKRVGGCADGYGAFVEGDFSSVIQGGCPGGRDESNDARSNEISGIYGVGVKDSDEVMVLRKIYTTPASVVGSLVFVGATSRPRSAWRKAATAEGVWSGRHAGVTISTSSARLSSIDEDVESFLNSAAAATDEELIGVATRNVSIAGDRLR